ncbi:hypothetical protein JRQ81_008708 [Phrynocephalus forsythii]|uniref:Uncharacterized protein n=1 Tax=Phrynocephalus forsythii TaxID=171643 RepID=A0A9Q0XAJ7_9SAUR|nr:hypothetical protein JRQ81_008708 [Phrynocephalus forsythii]
MSSRPRSAAACDGRRAHAVPDQILRRRGGETEVPKPERGREKGVEIKAKLKEEKEQRHSYGDLQGDRLGFFIHLGAAGGYTAGVSVGTAKQFRFNSSSRSIFLARGVPLPVAQSRKDGPVQGPKRSLPNAFEFSSPPVLSARGAVYPVVGMKRAQMSVRWCDIFEEAYEQQTITKPSNFRTRVGGIARHPPSSSPSPEEESSGTH